jgi:hypothetical protein
MSFSLKATMKPALKLKIKDLQNLVHIQLKQPKFQPQGSSSPDRVFNATRKSRLRVMWYLSRNLLQVMVMLLSKQGSHILRSQLMKVFMVLLTMGLFTGQACAKNTELQIRLLIPFPCPLRNRELLLFGSEIF